MSRRRLRNLRSCKYCSSTYLASEDDLCLHCKRVDLDSLIKERCGMCGDFIQYDKYRYILIGNFCQVCNIKVNRNILVAIEKRKADLKKKKAKELRRLKRLKKISTPKSLHYLYT